MTEIDELYELYFKDVYRFIYSLSKDKTVSEDIMSETFIKVLKSVDSFKGEGGIKVWIFQIAKYTYYSSLRKNRKEVGDAVAEREADLNIEEEGFMLRLFSVSWLRLSGLLF